MSDHLNTVLLSQYTPMLPAESPVVRVPSTGWFVQQYWGPLRYCQLHNPEAALLHFEKLQATKLHCRGKL